MGFKLLMRQYFIKKVVNIVCGSDGKLASAYNMGDLGSIPGLGRYPAEGNGNPLWYSCLGNPMDRGAWQATVQTQLSD